MFPFTENIIVGTAAAAAAAAANDGSGAANTNSPGNKRRGFSG